MAFPDSIPRLDQPVRLDLPSFFEPVLTRTSDVPALRMLVDGHWREADGGDTFDVVSPIDGGVIARAPRAGKSDVLAAIEAARSARADFRALPAAERLELCERAAEIMGDRLDVF